MTDSDDFKAVPWLDHIKNLYAQTQQRGQSYLALVEVHRELNVAMIKELPRLLKISDIAQRIVNDDAGQGDYDFILYLLGEALK